MNRDDTFTVRIEVANGIRIFMECALADMVDRGEDTEADRKFVEWVSDRLDAWVNEE